MGYKLLKFEDIDIVIMEFVRDIWVLIGFIVVEVVIQLIIVVLPIMDKQLMKQVLHKELLFLMKV